VSRGSEGKGMGVRPLASAWLHLGGRVAKPLVIPLRRHYPIPVDSSRKVSGKDSARFALGLYTPALPHAHQDIRMSVRISTALPI